MPSAKSQRLGEYEDENLDHSVPPLPSIRPGRLLPGLHRIRPIYIVVNEDGASVSGYATSGGTLTPLPASPFAAGNFPTSVAVDPLLKFAYVANSADNTIS